MKIAGTTALVTGAGAGIGRACALELAKAGATVIATDVDQAGLDSLVSEAQDKALPIIAERLDVTDREAWQALAERHGEVAILINNAGIGYFGTVFETPRWAWDKIMAINLMGVVNGCEAFGPLMAASGKPACLVNVASAASANPVPNLSAYAASKFAVEGFSDVLAMELAETAVKVMTVHPGIINTAIVQDPRTVSPSIPPEQMDRLQNYYQTKGCLPDVVARDVVAGIRADKAKVFTGPVAALSGWLRRLAPTGLRRKMTRKSARDIGYLA